MSAIPTNPSEPKKGTPKKGTPKKATPKKATPKKGTKKKGGPSDEWYTPKAFVNALAELLDVKFVLDVAATLESKKADAFFGKKDDGLSKDWHAEVLHLSDTGTASAWLNPPYSAPGPWVAKAAKTARDGTTVVALLRSSTGTSYWLKHIWPHAAEVNFVTGRMAYEKVNGTAGAKANHDSAVVVWRPGHAGAPRVRVIDTDGNVLPRQSGDARTEASTTPTAGARSHIEVVPAWPQADSGEEAA